MKSFFTAISIVLALYVGSDAVAGGGFESVKFLREIRAKIKQPVDIALGDNGEVYLLDEKSLMVKVYDENGSLLRQFGGDKLFKRPVSLAVGPGMVVVADERLKKVLVFDEQGKKLTSFGGSGKLAGQFGKLRDVEVDQFGFIYVADAGNKAISRFSDRGILLSFTPVNPRVPLDIALDNDRYIYALMKDGLEVYRKHADDRSGKWARLRFNPAPKGVAGIFVDHKGDIYLTQGKKNNVVKYDVSGNLLASFGSRGKGPGAFNTPSRLAGNNRGELYVVDYKNRRAQVFVLAGNDKRNLALASHSPPTVSYAGTELVKETITDMLWHSEDLQLRLFGKSGQILSKGLETRVVGGTGRKPGQFRKPGGLAQLAGGRTVVADTGNHRIQIISPDGRFTVFGERGDEAGFFKNPSDVAVNSEGMIYVADSGNSRIQIFSDQGIYLHSFGRRGKSKKGEPAAIGLFDAPTHVAIDSQDRVYVLDPGNQRVSIFDAKGEGLFLVKGFGKPADLALDEKDNLYVADNECHCVRVLAPLGKWLMRFGSAGDGLGQMKAISAVMVGGNQVFVADAGLGKVKKYNLALGGLTVEERLKVSHNYYVPIDLLENAEKMAEYRALALENAAAKLAGVAGLPLSEVNTQMRVDKEVVLPGGEVHMVVSIVKPPASADVSQPASPVQEAETEDDKDVELAF